MPHINEDTLIQYRFDLLDPDERQAASQHLEACDECRGRLVALALKFSSLDLLGDEIEPSEALIQQTVRSQIPAARRMVWKKVNYYLSVAAVLAVGSLLYMAIQVEKSLPEEAEEKVIAQDLTAQQPEANRPLRMATLMERPSAPAPADTLVAGARFDDQAGVKLIPAEQIPDKPPFAPASAIELVVLPRPDRTQLTIYNSADLTLVRDTRKLTLKAGWNWLQFMWSDTLIDPTSLSIRPLAHADKVEVEQLVYPAGLKDIGRWLIRSEVEGAVPFEITYFASGLSWRAFYMGTLDEDETHMDLAGFVRVENDSGQDYENAQTRLVIGQINLLDEIAHLARRHYPYGPEPAAPEEEFNDSLTLGFPVKTEQYFFGARGGMMGGMAGAFYYAEKEIAKEGLSEYTLYTIEGTETIPNEWAKRLPSLNVEDIPVKSLYKYDEDRYAADTIRFVSFANDADHELGDTPLPEGSVRLFRHLNPQRELAYIGAADVKYIPVNEDVELNLGPARLVKIEPVLMDTATANYTFDRKGNINGWDEIQTWQIKLTNTRALPVDVEITRAFKSDTWDLELLGSPPVKGEYPEGGRGFIPDYKKHDVTRARFTTTLPPATERTFEYTVTIYHGRRAELKANKTSN